MRLTASLHRTRTPLPLACTTDLTGPVDARRDCTTFCTVPVLEDRDEPDPTRCDSIPSPTGDTGCRHEGRSSAPASAWVDGAPPPVLDAAAHDGSARSGGIGPSATWSPRPPRVAGTERAVDGLESAGDQSGTAGGAGRPEHPLVLVVT